MVSSNWFDGIKADLITLVGGVVTLFFIILGLAMLMRAGRSLGMLPHITLFH